MYYLTTSSFPKVIVSVIDEWLWKTGGTILAGENGSTPSKTHRGAISSTTNSTRIRLGLNPSLCGDQPMTAHLRYKMSILTSQFLKRSRQSFSFLPPDIVYLPPSPLPTKFCHTSQLPSGFSWLCECWTGPIPTVATIR